MDEDDEAVEHGPTKRLLRRPRRAEPRAADLIENYLAEQRREIEDLLAECVYLDAALAALRGLVLDVQDLEARLHLSARHSPAVAIGPGGIPAPWRYDDMRLLITCSTDWDDDDDPDTTPPHQMLRVAAQGYAPQRRKLEPLRQEIVTILRDAGLVVTP